MGQLKTEMFGVGDWVILENNKKYFGEVHLNNEYGLIYLKFRLIHDGSMNSFTKMPLKINSTSGVLIDGTRLTLLNGKRIRMQRNYGKEDTFEYIFDYMIEGAIFESTEEIIFSKMFITLPTLLKWGTVTNYIKPELDKTDKIIGLKVIDPIKVFENDVFSIEYNVSFTNPIFHLTFLEEKIILKQTPYLIIKSKEMKNLNFFILQLKKFLGLIEIAIGRAINIDVLKVWNPKYDYNIDVTKIENYLNVVHKFSTPKKGFKEDSRIREFRYLFNLIDLTSQGSLENWFKKYELLEPIIDLYLETIYKSDLSDINIFLNMTQALETYHSRILSPGNVNDFKKRVEDITLKVEGTSRKKTREYLLDNIRSRVTFSSRIKDLIIANYEIIFYLGGYNRLEFPDIITKTRNYYTHYNIKDKDKALTGESLVDAYLVLKYLLEYYFMKELGFENQFIKKSIQNQWENVKNRIYLREDE